MIDRYTRPEMKRLWSDENRFRTWFEVELAVLEILGRRGVVPVGAARDIRKSARIRVDRIHEIEKTTQHDVIAFTTSIAEQSEKSGRFFHYGLTSSDVVDTALSLLMGEALDLILGDLGKLDAVLVRQSRRFRKLPTIGRTHGMHAEPMSFGLKFLGWTAEMRRQRSRLETAREGMRTGKLSGAVGIYGALGPEVERDALDRLGLRVEPVATQVVPRDRHAEVFCALAGLGASVERIAVELRHLQRTEVQEVEEEFREGQKGSSAMPHKRNPVSSENLTGCARLLRGYAVAALENVALWHERDISHSSVERVIAPDATTLAHYMIQRLARLLSSLKVNKGNVAANLDRTKGIYFSGQVLLKLVEAGLSREEAYRIVQKSAFNALKKGRPFGDELRADPEVRKRLSRVELRRVLDIKTLLRHVDTIYGRVLSDGKKRPATKR